MIHGHRLRTMGKNHHPRKSTTKELITSTASSTTGGSSRSHTPRTVTRSPEHHGWLDSLVRQSTAEAKHGSLKKNGRTGDSLLAPITLIPKSKEERIQHRALKKERRMASRHPSTQSKYINNSDRTITANGSLYFGDNGPQRMQTVDTSLKRRSNTRNQELIKDLTHRIDHAITPHLQDTSSSQVSNTEETDRHKRNRVFEVSNEDKKSVLTKGRETTSSRKRIRQWDPATIQPRVRDYGGIGLARPSLYLPFNDVSFLPKLEQEFREHIPGFFGKQRTKAMKKQLNQNMLWKRVRAVVDGHNPSRTNGRSQATLSAPSDHRINGKKLADMTPDERVEAMLKAGLI